MLAGAVGPVTRGMQAGGLALPAAGAGGATTSYVVGVLSGIGSFCDWRVPPLKTGAVSGLLDHNPEWTNSWICTNYPFEFPCNNLCEKGTLLVM